MEENEQISNNEREQEKQESPLDMINTCPHCGRNFNRISAFSKHVENCEKVFKNKREKFNAKKQRIIDSKHEYILNQNELKPKKEKTNNKSKDDIPKWKKESLEFRNICNPQKVNENDVELPSKNIFINETYQGAFDNNEDKNKNLNINKYDIENIPIKKNDLGYTTNINSYDNLSDNVKDIIYDPKYNEKRSQSLYSKKSFREKFESMKLKVPELKEWNCDPTAEIIIHNLELKIDILTYENFLLTKKLKKIMTNCRELQLNLSQNDLLLKSIQINNENFPSNNNNLPNKGKNKKKDNDIDSYKEINELKNENYKLKLSNENLAENNMKLNKIIEQLKNEINLNNEQFEVEIKNNRKFFEKKLLEEKRNYDIELNNIMSKDNNMNTINNNINTDNIKNDNINNENINNDNINNDNIENDNIKERNDIINNNSNFGLNKYIINEEEQYRQLLEENEQLHKKLRYLLSIEDDDINKFSSSFPENIHNLIYTQTKVNDIQFNSNNNNNNTIQSENLLNENNMLKQKINFLNSELDRVNRENNQKLKIIQEKFRENEIKNKKETIKDSKDINLERDNNSNEELDKILNETVLLTLTPKDEESKKMITTIENMNNNNKKRLSQCLIINNKLKSLSEENNFLQSQVESLQKSNNLNYSNNNKLDNFDNSNPNICFCKGGNNESYDYLINALKIKDEIIIKYKEKNEDSENKYKALILENSKLKEKFNINNNDLHYKKIEIKKNQKKRDRPDGLEDYLFGKIMNNQKEVLGERAPRFCENDYEMMSKSMQIQDNRKFNNYHYYNGARMTNYQ